MIVDVNNNRMADKVTHPCVRSVGAAIRDAAEVTLTWQAAEVTLARQEVEQGQRDLAETFHQVTMTKLGDSIIAPCGTTVLIQLL